MPEDWKNAIVIPFLKSSKPPTSPSSYRPIALTSLAKTYKSIIYITYLHSWNKTPYRLTPAWIQKGLFNNWPFRETGTRNTRCILHKQHCLAVFFDLEKAYDTTWRYGILWDLGIRGRMLNCLCDFLSNRTFQVRLGTVLSRIFVQDNGVPQGCILSTTLFIVKMNSINMVIPHTVMHSFYVDDLQIACCASNQSSCERQLHFTINKPT